MHYIYKIIPKGWNCLTLSCCIVYFCIWFVSKKKNSENSCGVGEFFSMFNTLSFLTKFKDYQTSLNLCLNLVFKYNMYNHLKLFVQVENSQWFLSSRKIGIKMWLLKIWVSKLNFWWKNCVKGGKFLALKTYLLNHPYQIFKTSV